jgi:hypothetical protein
MKKCVVKSFNINYTPVNVPAFFDGNPDAPHPVAITCTINLKELEYMLSNDWVSGNTDTINGFAGNLAFNNASFDINPALPDPAQ